MYLHYSIASSFIYFHPPHVMNDEELQAVLLPSKCATGKKAADTRTDGFDSDESISDEVIEAECAHGDKDEGVYLSEFNSYESLLEELIEASFLYAVILIILVPIQAYTVPPPNSLIAYFFVLFTMSLMNLLLATHSSMSGNRSIRWLRFSFGLNILLWIIITVLDSTLCFYVNINDGSKTYHMHDASVRYMAVVAVIGGIMHCTVWTYCFFICQRCLEPRNACNL